MDIKKIVNEGDKLSEKNLLDICGGADMMANVNSAFITCHCRGTGDNTNKGLWCSCREDGPIVIQQPTPTPKPSPAPYQPQP